MVKSSFRELIKDIKQHTTEKPQTTEIVKSLSETTASERKDDDELQKMLPEDTRQEGRVKLRIYVSFVRAGAGIIGGILLPLIFSIHQALGMFNNWWLASWSEYEGQRHSGYSNCTNMSGVKDNVVRNMTDIEWNQYRNNRFYIYCGL